VIDYRSSLWRVFVPQVITRMASWVERLQLSGKSHFSSFELEEMVEVAVTGQSSNLGTYREVASSGLHR